MTQKKERKGIKKIIFYIIFLTLSINTFAQQPELEIFNLTVDEIEKNIFSPNNDSVEDIIEIDLKFFETVKKVALVITKENETESLYIKEIYESPSVKDPKIKQWDGTNEENEIVENGIYYAKVFVNDSLIQEKQIIVNNPSYINSTLNNTNITNTTNITNKVNLTNQTNNNLSNYYTKNEINLILNNLNYTKIKNTDELEEGELNFYFTKNKLIAFLNQIYPQLDTNKSDDINQNYTCKWENIINKPTNIEPKNLENTITTIYQNENRQFGHDILQAQNIQNEQLKEEIKKVETKQKQIEKKIPQETLGVNIFLNKGWSEFRLPSHILKGTNFTPQLDLNNNYTIKNVLKSIDGNYSYIAYYDTVQNLWKTYSPNSTQNNFYEFPISENTPNYIFSIYMTNSDNLEIPIIQN